MGKLLRLPARPLAAQRVLSDVEHALAANDFERSEALREIRQLQARLDLAKADLASLDEDKAVLDIERDLALLRVEEEAVRA